ncbi:hypothetical protein DdX_13813 [Ditylenchus destructor]|uniref:Secreted protein n=1 Tax=Ditylenchus destructor TaxID=166010 RepID=A0AAD4MST3_9BILA|nr:hypothetical protein DdX_13813 [Ditylenchus destructor]
MRSFLSIQLFLVATFVLILNIDKLVAPEGSDESDGGFNAYPDNVVVEPAHQDVYGREPKDNDSIIRVREPKKNGAPKQEKPHHAGDTVASTKRREATAAEKAAKNQPAKTPKVTPIDKHSHLLTETASGKAAGRRGPGDK